MKLGATGEEVVAATTVGTGAETTQTCYYHKIGVGYESHLVQNQIRQISSDESTHGRHASLWPSYRAKFSFLKQQNISITSSKAIKVI